MKGLLRRLNLKKNGRYKIVAIFALCILYLKSSLRFQIETALIFNSRVFCFSDWRFGEPCMTNKQVLSSLMYYIKVLVDQNCVF